MNHSIVFSEPRALELLKIATQDPLARFRPGQLEAIREIVDGTNRIIVVQKTGWGKSFVYFIATKLLREAGLGPTLLISPLLSLMRNQVAAAERMGLFAIRMDSSNPEQEKEAQRLFIENAVDVLMVTEMRLSKLSFQQHVIGAARKGPSLLVVDEVHCISDWGHDFRPLYRRIELFVRNSPTSLRVLGTTATANDRVLLDVKSVFGDRVVVQRGDLSRNNLILQTIRLESRAERLAWMATTLSGLEGTGIVYVLTKADSETVAKWLEHQGIAARAYHSALSSEDRNEIEQELMANAVKVVVATSALGMGFDKPDLTFVIHYQMPGSVVTYYQQVGRAGRGVPQARGILLGGMGDQEILSHFRETAFPSQVTVGLLLDVLDRSEHGLSLSDLEAKVNLRRKTIEHALRLLSLENPAPIVERDDRWYRTTSPLSSKFWDRVERVTAIRVEEKNQMQEYLALSEGHLAFLVAALNGDPSTVAPINADMLPSKVDDGMLQAATSFLKRTLIPIKPRKRLPGGGVPGLHQGSTLPREWQTEEGRALAYWGDAGWGTRVKQGKYELGCFQDELVKASANLIREWGTKLDWVSAVPSHRHPALVRDFAVKLATELGLEFKDAVYVENEREPQKSQENSYFQAANAAAAFAVDVKEVRSGPCLLVDDVVDSGWTFTAVGKMLRVAGSGPIYPFALAMVLGGGDDS